jgi:hypothetical protein
MQALPQRRYRKTAVRLVPTRLWLMLAGITLLTAGCAGVQLVAPYDEAIYQGLIDYKEELNLHVKNMADLGGTTQGTYEANVLKYNAMETRLEMLMDRARTQSTGVGCSLSPALAKKVDSYLREEAPPELSSAPTSDSANSYGCTEILLGKVRQQLDFLQLIHRESDRCPLRVSGISQQVEIVERAPAAEIDLNDAVDQAVADVVESLRHGLTVALLSRLEGAMVTPAGETGEPDAGEAATVSCLRQETAVDALAISNQSIDAAWFVENAKKQGAE